jgi:transcriptional regulator with XRE-family HTH domain
MTIGDRIIALRTALGLKQSQLARLIKISQPSMSLIESGTTKALKGPTLERACKVLRTNPDWLNHGIGAPGPIQVATEEYLEIVDLWRLLNDDSRNFLLTTARALASQDAKPTVANPFPKNNIPARK